jgi:hypothetical protein
MRYLVVSHGDVDGIISAALVVKKHGLDLSQTDVVFTQPFLVDKIKPAEYEEVYVVDLAINNREPEMTKHFIEETLRDKLVYWYDHHKGWYQSKLTDERFVIDEAAMSCAAVIGGPAQWIEAANAIDSRKGESELGQLLDQAMKVNLSDDAVRRVAFEYVLGLNDGEILQKKQQEYQAIERKTEELVQSGEVDGKVLVIDTRREVGFDRTQIFMKGYQRAPFVVVLGEFEGKVTTTVATNTKTNLVEVFELKSGAPFRITLEGDRVSYVVQKLNNLSL